jgi:peptidoglycan-associated lipoprotein
LTVNFDFDKSDLTPEGRAILADNARKLEQNPEVFIRLEGHCDERGTVEYNLALGERRARSVRDYLVNFGISPGRMTVISYGKERPVDPGQNESAWAKNRRAEFVILN